MHQDQTPARERIREICAEIKARYPDTFDALDDLQDAVISVAVEAEHMGARRHGRNILRVIAAEGDAYIRLSEMYYVDQIDDRDVSPPFPRRSAELAEA